MRFRDMPIRRKLTAIMLLTSSPPKTVLPTTNTELNMNEKFWRSRQAWLS